MLLWDIVLYSYCSFSSHESLEATKTWCRNSIVLVVRTGNDAKYPSKDFSTNSRTPCIIPTDDVSNPIATLSLYRRHITFWCAAAASIYKISGRLHFVVQPRRQNLNKNVQFYYRRDTYKTYKAWPKKHKCCFYSSWCWTGHSDQRK